MPAFRFFINLREETQTLMDVTVGAILDGTVRSITKFGAFIDLPGGKTGMVHISEISNTFVSDIRQHLNEGDPVRVMVIAVDPAGKISLSIKRLLQQQKPNNKPKSAPRRPAEPRPPLTFEDKLKQFMADSDSKISSCRQYADHKTKSRRR